MPRSFNTAGPCRADIDYMLPPRVRLPSVRPLIDDQRYFVLHAPRQTGKTTALLSLAAELTASGEYVAVLMSMEVGVPFEDDPGAAENAILGSWRRAAGAQLPEELQPPPWPDAQAGDGIGAALEAWSLAAPRPLVVFLDEIDALADEALISVLRQLRDGYRNRPDRFPWSLALMGLRDVRDYKFSAGDAGRLGTASPFNIKIESITLRDFTADEVAALYQQHTDETGQVFTPEAVAWAYELTRGQPWLVNALARQITWYIVPDRAEPITLTHMERAKEELIARQDTHLDSLAERLREPRVRAVIEPILAGTAAPRELPEDDIRYAVDLGLVRLERRAGDRQPYLWGDHPPVAIHHGARLPAAVGADLAPGRRPVDIGRLLEAFLVFWREHGQALMKGVPYAEVAPHLVLMAFLDRVRNTGGTLAREYAVGSRRVGPAAALWSGHVRLRAEGVARRPAGPAGGGPAADRRRPGRIGAGHGLAGDLRPSQRPAGD